MWDAMVPWCNSLAEAWAGWMGNSILAATIVLAAVSLLWLAMRRKSPPQLGYLLFLLVPLRLFVPLEIALPERMVAWCPNTASWVFQEPSTASVPPAETPPRDAQDAFGPAPAAARASAPVSSATGWSDPGLEPEKNTPSPVPRVVPASARPSLAAWLLLAWTTGVMVLLARLVLSHVRFVRRIVDTSRPVDPALFPVDFPGLLRRMGLKRPIRVVQSDRLASPVVCGIVRPVLILPAGIAPSLSQDQLEWVLLHELAHVRRRDLAVRCFQCLATILHFVNPAVWAANRMINRLREFVCDDMALALTRGSRLQSGEAFLSVVRYAASVKERREMNLDGAIGVFESTTRTSCFERMKRLLDADRRVRVRLGLGSLCVLLLTAALALPQLRAATNPERSIARRGAIAAETPNKKTGDDAAAIAPSYGSESKGAASPKKGTDRDDAGDQSVYHFSVVIARHVILLDGREIVDWPQVEAKIAERPNPSLTHPHFYVTRGAHEAGLYEPSKAEIWRLHRDYNLVGHSEGSLWPRTDLRYDRIETADDLKPDESLRVSGQIVTRQGAPVADAEVVLITPIDASIGYKAYHATLDRGRVHNPLEHLMTRSDKRGRFTLFPPKGQDFYLLAMHPEGGIALARRDSLLRDHKVTLLEWAGLVAMFAGESEEQTASLTTRVPAAGALPEIVLGQDSDASLRAKSIELDKSGKLTATQAPNDRLKINAPSIFFFKHVPPIWSTALYRMFPGREGVSHGLPEASVEPLPGETRRLDLGSLTDEQREFLKRLRLDSEERMRQTESESRAAGADGGAAAVQSARGGAIAAETPNEKTGDDAAAIAPSYRSFELTVLGPDKKPVPHASVEIRGDMLAPEATSKASRPRLGYRTVARTTDANGRLTLRLLPRAGQFIVAIETPGFAPYWAQWNASQRAETIPPRFTAELEGAWSVGGIVVDDRGRPQQGVIIHPSVKFKKRPGDQSELGIGAELTTDAEGRWRFDSVPNSMNEVFVEINHPSFKPTRRPLTRDAFGLRPGQQPTTRIKLSRGLIVTGRVTDDMGSPVAGALIRTKFGNDIRQATTNENGDYQLVGCEPRMTRIVVSAKGLAMDMQEVRVATDMEPVDFQLQPGRHIRVRVLDQHGKPAARSRIFFQEWRGSIEYFEFDHINQYADRNGVWEWNEAPLDEFKADICPRNGGMQLVERTLQARDKEFVFRTYPKLVVSGRVVDSETKKPVKSFRVVPGIRGYDEPNAASGPTHVDWVQNESLAAKDGRYRVTFDREYVAHLVRIEADGYQVAVSRDVKSDEGNVTIDFALTPAKDVAATVLAPDGRPAAGAKIALGVAGSQISVKNGQFQDGSTYADRYDADDAGRFHFPARTEPFQLVVLHPSGFAHLKSPDDKVGEDIRLTPWARVEGTFRVGAKPGSHVGLEIMNNSVHSYGQDVPSIFTQHETTTDAAGRYVFPRVFPGRASIGRRIILMVADGATETTSSIRMVAEFPAGKTTRLALGGTGRAVVGRLAPPAGRTEKVLWQFAMIDVQVDIPRPEPPPAPPGVKDNPQASRAWMKEWTATDEGKAWRAAYEKYKKRRSAGPFIWATVARDGSFRIDDVPPGDYVLSVRFSEHPAGRLADHRFTVDPIDAGRSGQPITLETLTLGEN